MMKKLIVMMAVVLACGVVLADTFNAGGANEFTIDFVDISGDASSANGTNFAHGGTFTDPDNDYRMGKFEITNDQFAKFASNSNVHFTGADVPSNMVSWYEGAMFVNFLNASTGNPAAYNFSGSTFGVWEPGDAGYDADNPNRNSNAHYFMPTENEWVKAAYWNGAILQAYATKQGDTLYQGNGSNGGWNYSYGSTSQPWDIGSGSEELNGTFDMMGNLFEWVETKVSSSARGARGGSYYFSGSYLSLSGLSGYPPSYENGGVGFRVASVPEPCSLALLSLGGLILRRRKKV